MKKRHSPRFARRANRITHSAIGLTLFVGTMNAAVPARAEDNVSEQARWGFFFNLGAGDLHGDFDSSLQKATTGEFGIVRAQGPWRYAFGLSFGSFGMTPPYDHEPEWGFQRIFVSGTRMFRAESSLRPYLQGRLGIVRLHPRSLLFEMDPLPEDFEVGDSPTKASNGLHIGIVPGLEWRVSPGVSLDLSLLLDYFKVGDTDLSPVAGGTASSGFDWQARLGVLWWNSGETAADWANAEYDVWGVRKSYGWGIGEALAINFGASAFNEYVRNANFNQISPRSWWANLEEGFTYDDNQFKTNQYIHPFNGSQYYNAARSNGISFWPSYGVALMGAFQWEWMGETHPMSFNDLISTGIGGAALGETLYRLGSMVLDTETTGTERFFREAGSFIVNPIRGFNRIVTGRAWDVRPNPSDPMDTNPTGSFHGLQAGYRRIGNGEYPSLTHDTSDYFFMRYLHNHGIVFDNTRRGPWDYFTIDAQLNVGDKTGLGLMLIRGNWFTTPVGEADPMNHAVGIVQHFEYINNNAYEFGGQSIGPAYFGRWGSGRSISLNARADVMATIMGAVNSDYSELAVVANQERVREYDYGPGVGGNAALLFGYRGEPLLTLGYFLRFIYVTNGSIYNGGDPELGDEFGLDARHWLHGVSARFDTPTVRNFGLGAEYFSFTRESHYKVRSTDPSLSEFSLTQLLKQTNPELRIYLRYSPGVH